MLNIVFMGSPDFAVPSLEALHASSHRISAVVSNPDRRRGRGTDRTPTAVKKRALELDYPVIDVESPDDPMFARRLKMLEPDLLVVVAFRILPPVVLEVPRIGSINLHASLLPKYRGAAPIHWAIMNGEAETGCSVFFLDERVDTGNVIRQVRTRIGPNETTGDLYARMKGLGADLLAEAVDQIERDETEGVPQEDSEASPAPKLFRKDAKIDFTLPATTVHNKIRGLSPHPGAWTLYGNQKMNLHRSRKGPDIDLEPGELLFVEGRQLLAGCGTGSVELTELQLPGKGIIRGTDFAHGYKLDNRLS